MKNIIIIFSYLFHPLFIVGYATLYYLNGTEKYFALEEKAIILSQIIIVTVFIPLGVYLILRQLHQIESIMMASVKERRIPLAINAILLFLLSYQTITYDYAPELHLFLTACLYSSILALLFSFIKTKASLHMIATVALLCFVLILDKKTSLDVAIKTFLIISVGAVATSRLIMKAHDVKELIYGFFIGIIPPLVLYYEYWL